jgi:protein-tyrosine phosphatase
VPGLLQGLRAGVVPTLHKTRYLLLEPSHHVAPPRFAESVFQLVAAGYVPVITHPERLTWIEDHFQVFADLTRQGAWIQVTAGALTGLFGSRAKYWGECFLGDGLTHIIATDAHSSVGRVPVMSEARAVAERMLGRDEAQLLVEGRQAAVLQSLLPSAIPPLPTIQATNGWWKNPFSRRK